MTATSFEKTQLDSLWQMENKYFNQFERVSLPLGGFNHNDFLELYQLCKEHIDKTNPTKLRIADVGCWTGMSSLLLSLLLHKIEGKVYAVDWFRGSPKTNLDFAGNYFNIKKIFDDNIIQFESGKKIEVIEKVSTEASKDFENESLDIVFLDADHRYIHIKRDIDLWLPKLKKGGLLCGHDCEIIFEQGINALYDIYNDEDKAEVIHVGVCRAVTELGGKKTRSINPFTKQESLTSGIWYYIKP